jgi:hypothetical protein
MRSKFSQPSVITHRVVAFALTLWLGGVGCLMGCEMIVQASPSVESGVITDEGSSCSTSSDGYNCCQTPKIADNITSFGTLPPTTLTPSCCPLAGQSDRRAGLVSALTLYLLLLSRAGRCLLQIFHPLLSFSLSGSVCRIAEAPTYAAVFF